MPDRFPQVGDSVREMHRRGEAPGTIIRIGSIGPGYPYIVVQADCRPYPIGYAVQNYGTSWKYVKQPPAVHPGL